jgi:cytochrome P450
MFRNGDRVPEGSLVSIPTYAVHWDERWYSDPDTFDGFQFTKQEGRSSARLLKSQGDVFLAFGYGRHAW